MLRLRSSRVDELMHELERIEAALESKSVNHDLFERFAQDALSDMFPGLVPIPGGTDWGRDADIIAPGGTVPPRLLVTASRTLDGVQANLRRGIKSMTDHGLPYDELVLCNIAVLSQLDRVKLQQTAQRLGARLEFHNIFDRAFAASKLRRDGEWRQRLLGLSADPISLARSPASLMESPWASLQFVGRETDYNQLVASDGDVILTGPPGVGKSRLLAEMPAVLFVDRDASLARLTDDIRWLEPTVLAVDDAGTAERVLLHLVRLRQVEGDIARYRVVAVCWPDEVETLRDVLPGAEVLVLDLLERPAIDQVVRSMGVTGSIARSELLDQAEGRPGWAVALADLLVSSGDATSLLSGRALLGEVQRFIRRSQSGSETTTLLVLISALGGVREDELPSLQSELGTSRHEVTRQIRSAATSGLIDVSSAYDWSSRTNVRIYTVRPPMLARALVAEQVFGSSVPVLDLLDVADRWPRCLAGLAEAGLFSVLLGAAAAKDTATTLFRRAVGADQLTSETKLNLCRLFAAVDMDAAEEVLQLLSAELPSVYDSDPSDYWRGDPLLDVVKGIARRHVSQRAMRVLLDAAIRDSRPTNQYTSHPLRALDDLLHDFHPELPVPDECRTALAAVLLSWISEAGAPDADRWRIFGIQVGNVLSFSLGSAFTRPEDPHTVQLVQTVVSPREMRRIFDELWPPLRQILEQAPPEAIAEVVDEAVNWLRVGAGVDRPFGHSHSDEAVKAAGELGRMLIADLARLAQPHPGALRKVMNAVSWFDLEIDVTTADGDSPFFVDIHGTGDWRAAVREMEESIRSAVSDWEIDSPTAVVQRLKLLRRDIELAGLSWPDRVRMAFGAIAESASTLSDWIEVCIDESMFPQAGPLLTAAVAAGERLEMDLWRKCWDDPRCRWEAIALALTGSVPAEVYEAALEEVAPSDFTVIEQMLIRNELTSERISDLLHRTRDETRGAVAVAMFSSAGRDDSWSPGELEALWNDAIVRVDFTRTSGLHGWHVGELFKRMSQLCPNVLVELVTGRLQATSGAATGIYDALPHDAWDTLHLLPTEYKTRLWDSVRGNTSAGRILLEHLVGDDAGWLRIMLEAGLLTNDDALAAYSGFGPHPRIEDLAAILIPRGVDPRNIAGLAQAGTWTGEASHRYAQLAERFAAMVESEDPSIADVGRAGEEMYSAARDAALEDERRRRIRGDF